MNMPFHPKFIWTLQPCGRWRKCLSQQKAYWELPHEITTVINTVVFNFTRLALIKTPQPTTWFLLLLTQVITIWTTTQNESTYGVNDRLRRLYKGHLTEQFFLNMHSSWVQRHPVIYTGVLLLLPEFLREYDLQK